MRVRPVMPDGARPIFKDGTWFYAKPVFDSVPPPNSVITIMSWPHTITYENGEYGMRGSFETFKTPPYCDARWFETEVIARLGYNYSRWILVEDTHTKE